MEGSLREGCDARRLSTGGTMLASSLLRAISPCGKATRSPTTRAEWLAVRYPTAGTFPQGQAACWRRQKDARLLVPRNVPEVARGPYYSCAPTRPRELRLAPRPPMH